MAEGAVELYGALEVEEFEDGGTPLSAGSAQWWSLSSFDFRMHVPHSSIASRAKALGCVMEPSDSQQRKHLEAKRLRRCVLRIEAESPVDQVVRIRAEGSASDALSVAALPPGLPVKGALGGARHPDAYHLETVAAAGAEDGDADEQFVAILQSGNACKPSLSLRFPDGEVRTWLFPKSHFVRIRKTERPWTSGFFLILVRRVFATRLLSSELRRRESKAVRASPRGESDWLLRLRGLFSSAQIQDPDLPQGTRCPYTLQASIEGSQSRPADVHVLKTGAPVFGSVLADEIQHFVWTKPPGGPLETQLNLLRVVALQHNVETLVTRLRRGASFPQRLEPGEEPPPGVYKLTPLDFDPSTSYARVGKHVQSL